MFEPNVEVLWPEEVAQEKDDKIKFMVAFPDLSRIRLGSAGVLPITCLEEGHVTDKPSKVDNGWHTHVRSNMIKLGYYELTEEPADFMKKAYARCFTAAVQAYYEDTHTDVESARLQMYAVLLPYFKSAIKSAITHFDGKYRLRLNPEIAEVAHPALMDELPNIIVRMAKGTDVLDARVPNIQRSILKYWLERYKAEAECHKVTLNTRTFTPREARAVLKTCADAARKEGGRFSKAFVRLRKLPKVSTEINPLRVAVVQEPYQVGCSVKTGEHTGQGFKPTRMQYEEKEHRPGWGNGWSEYNQRRDYLVDQMCNNCDYNASVEEMKKQRESGDE
jgi:hypothetical protein